MADPLDIKTEELIAIGAAMGANCEPCLRYHIRQATEAGCTQAEMRRAVAVAQSVKETPARLMVNLAARLLDAGVPHPGPGGPCEGLAARTAGAPLGSCCSSVPSTEETQHDSADGHH